MAEVTYFTSPTCMPCKKIRPKLEKFISESPTHELRVVDITEDQKTTTEFGVMKVPTIAVDGMAFEPANMPWSKVVEILEGVAR